MSTKALSLIDDFKSLPRTEQWAVYEVIARSVAPEDCGALSDEELTKIAGQTFAMLDEEEARAGAR